MVVVNLQHHLTTIFFYSKGISHKKPCPYSEQNDVAKRKHCHIVETAMPLIFHFTVSLEL